MGLLAYLLQSSIDTLTSALYPAFRFCIHQRRSHLPL